MSVPNKKPYHSSLILLESSCMIIEYGEAIAPQRADNSTNEEYCSSIFLLLRGIWICETPYSIISIMNANK